MAKKIKLAKTLVRKAGRPSKADGLNEPSAKQRIVETALLLFYKYGIHTVGVDRIIAESQVAKMTFFKHFPTKQDLVLEFLKVRDDRYMYWFAKTLTSITQDKKKQLNASIEVAERWFKDPQFRGCAFINTTADVGPGDQKEKIICVYHKRRLADFLQGLAEEAGYKNAKKLANQLLTIIDGATVRAQMDGPEAGITALRDCAKDILKSHQS